MANKHFDHGVLDDGDDAPLVDTITNTLHLAAQLGMDPGTNHSQSDSERALPDGDIGGGGRGDAGRHTNAANHLAEGRCRDSTGR